MGAAVLLLGWVHSGTRLQGLTKRFARVTIARAPAATDVGQDGILSRKTLADNVNAAEQFYNAL